MSLCRFLFGFVRPIILVSAGWLVISCSGTTAIYPVVERDAFIFSGTLNRGMLETLKRRINEAPHVSNIFLRNVPQAIDEQNYLMDLGKFIRTKKITTIVPKDGLVAAGGINLLLMGTTRIIHPTACVGIQSWKQTRWLHTTYAADLPRNDAIHEIHLQFYREFHIPEEFYWFTLQTAPSDKIHWLSSTEINRYSLSSTNLNVSLAETDQKRDKRCDDRHQQYQLVLQGRL